MRLESSQPEKNEKKYETPAPLRQSLGDVQSLINETETKIDEIDDETIREKFKKKLSNLKSSMTNPSAEVYGEFLSKVLTVIQKAKLRTEKMENKNKWTELLNKIAPDAKFNESKVIYSFQYLGKNIEIECDEGLRIRKLKILKPEYEIHYQQTGSVEDLELSLQNIMKLPNIIAEKLNFPMPENTHFESSGKSRFDVKLKTRDGIKNYFIISSPQFEKIFEKTADNKLITLNKDTWWEIDDLGDDDFNLIGHKYNPPPTEKKKETTKLLIQSESLPKTINSPFQQPTEKNGKKSDFHLPPITNFEAEKGAKISFINGRCEKIFLKAKIDVRYKETFNSEETVLSDTILIEITEEYLPNGDLNETTIYHFPEKYTQLPKITLITKEETLYSKGGSKKWEKKYNQHGLVCAKIEYDIANKTETKYDTKGKPIYLIQTKHGEPKTSKRYLLDSSGQTLGSYEEEKTKKPSLTHDEYIEMLAKTLDTPEKWHTFLLESFEYTHDSSDPNKPFEEGKEESVSEYNNNPLAIASRERIATIGEIHQSPETTLNRMNKTNEKMKGDCEDYGFLVQAILKKQGIKSINLLITEHALCVYIKKRPDNRYNIYSFDTGGITINGSYLTANGIVPNQKGFSTPEEAINSIYELFKEKNPTFRLQNGNITAVHLGKEKVGYFHPLSEIIN